MLLFQLKTRCETYHKQIVKWKFESKDYNFVITICKYDFPEPILLFSMLSKRQPVLNVINSLTLNTLLKISVQGDLCFHSGHLGSPH